MAFTAVALYGMAWLRRPESSFIGWLFVRGGVVGVILHLVGAAIPAFIFMETGAFGAVILLRERPSVSSPS
jgi:hydrogenase/urease accessory protein HupE